MLEAIARRLRLLNDFSVGAKLTFGFGLVLLSTFGVAATAFYSLDRLSDGAQRLRELASIRSQIQQVQVLQKDYALTLSPATAQSVKDNVNSLTQKLKVLSADSTVWGNLFEASGEYLEQFSTYSESLQAVRSARIQMQQMAEVANESFISVFLDRLDSLQLNLEGGKNTGEDPIIFLEQANGLRDKLARVRSSEQSFVLEKNEQFRDDWESNMSDLLSAIEILSLRLGAEEKKSLDAARVALGNYRGAFIRFNDGYVNAQKASTVMKVKADQLASSLVRVTEYLELDIVRGSRLANLQLAGISLLALIAGVIAVLFLRGQIVIPLRQVVHLAGRIADGDLSEEELHINRKDELGQLLETVRQMLNSLRGLVGRISNGVGRLNHVSSDLIDVIKRSGDIAEQQSEQMEIASAAANQMSASASASAESASAARQAVAQAEEQAQEGDQLVRIANTKMATLTEEMARAAAAMQSLLKESASIGGVLDVIKVIADQTNLLALNAAVEAARAGDYGRGFAVVADEVRSLAKRTQVSTREIEGLIGRLDRITQEAASRLHDSHALTDEAAELTDQVSESLSRIKSAVSSIEEMNCQISAAAEQQSHVAEQISINMMQIKENTESGVRESQSLSLAKDSLRAVGDELNDAVGIFVT